MTPMTLIRQIMNEKGITQVSLAAKMGYKSPGAIRNALNRKEGMQTNTMINMLNAMGCEVIVRDADGNEYVISE